MTKPNSTYIVGVIDRSASMVRIARDMQTGWNRFVEEQATLDGELRISLVEFDNNYEIFYWNRNPRVEYIPPYRLEPRGSTALLDALGITIENVGRDLKHMPEYSRPSQVLFVVITDGYENSSHRFTPSMISNMVEEQTKMYSWQFTYLGANQDAIMEGAKYSFNPNSTLTYDFNQKGVENAYSLLGNATSTYRGTGNFNYNK